MKMARILLIVLLAWLHHHAAFASANDNTGHGSFNEGYTATAAVPAGDLDNVHPVLLNGYHHPGRQVQHDTCIAAGSLYHPIFSAGSCYWHTGAHVSSKRYLDHLYPTHHFW